MTCLNLRLFGVLMFQRIQLVIIKCSCSDWLLIFSPQNFRLFREFSSSISKWIRLCSFATCTPKTLPLMTAKCFIASETHFKEVSKIQKFINSANNGCANVVLCRIIIYIEVCIIVFMLLFFLKMIYNYLELLPKNILSVIGMHRYATCRFIFLRTPFK